ncbi:hypothetical protein FRC07_005231 [Ceratobasidium sp. 392]|nr:hypothetical protein FRC07_005231 [Ceratobasidium sp. 392]
MRPETLISPPHDSSRPTTSRKGVTSPVPTWCWMKDGAIIERACSRRGRSSGQSGGSGTVRTSLGDGHAAADEMIFTSNARELSAMNRGGRDRNGLLEIATPEHQILIPEYGAYGGLWDTIEAWPDGEDRGLQATVFASISAVPRHPVLVFRGETRTAWSQLSLVTDPRIHSEREGQATHPVIESREAG